MSLNEARMPRISDKLEAEAAEKVREKEEKKDEEKKKEIKNKSADTINDRLYSVLLAIRNAAEQLGILNRTHKIECSNETKLHFGLTDSLSANGLIYDVVQSDIEFGSIRIVVSCGTTLIVKQLTI